MGKQKLFFKNVLVYCSIFLNEVDKEGVEYSNLRDDAEYEKKYVLSIKEEIYQIKRILKQNGIFVFLMFQY